MICKFCGEDKKLCDSHIIPAYFYRQYTPEDGKPLREIFTDTPYPKRRPVGYYEKLLCRTCEDVFEKWDNYGVNILSSSSGWVRESTDESDYTVLNNFDYIQLKLFFMSVLWRQHITTLKFFEKVDLGLRADILKQSLVNVNAGDIDHFGVFIFKHSSYSLDIEKTIVSPEKLRIDRIIYYKFNLNEFVIFIKVDKQNIPKSFQPHFLQPDSPLKVLERDFSSSVEFERMVKDIKKFQRLQDSVRK